MELKISQLKLEVTFQIGDKLNSTRWFVRTFRIGLVYKKKSDWIISLLFNFEFIYLLIFADFQSLFTI